MIQAEAGNVGWITRSWLVAFLVTLLVLVCGLFALQVSVRDFYSQYQINRLIEAAYNEQRPAGGRLFGAAYPSTLPMAGSDPDLGRAQTLLLRYPNSALRRKLQGQTHLASGNWQAAADTFAELARDTLRDPAVLNDLGVVYLALGENEGTYLLRALDQFELAAEAAPQALEPRFNLAIVYRKLRLPGLAGKAQLAYAKLDPASKWSDELSRIPPKVDESKVLQQLRRAVNEDRTKDASELIRQNPEIARRIAMQYGLRNISESEDLVNLIGREFAALYRDDTIAAMLSPLFAKHRERLIATRQMVQLGAELYLQGNLASSMDAYAQADNLVKETNSVFDRYWIDLNRVDTQVRIGDFENARQNLERLVAGARKHHFQWVLAKALSIHGSNQRLSPSYQSLMDSLAEADQIFINIGASYETVRPLYYLAGHTRRAGDLDEGLRIAFRCLSLTDDSDAVRKASLYWLIASILYRQGFPDRAALFATESLDEARKTQYQTLVSTAASTLALLYESSAHGSQAEQYLSAAEEAFGMVQSRTDKMRAELSLNLLKARMQVNRKQYADAESLLNKNLLIYSELRFRLTYFYAESLMLLARVYSKTGHIDEARESFRTAVQVVEDDDQYIQTEKLRLAFDDERRELYDSAIAFEYDHGAPDAAWSYLQKYRAKMFLEFLAQFNPNIERIRSEALNRSSVEKRIPKDAQAIEYVLLNDRLLIWVTSQELFTSRAVPVSRPALEQRVQQILAKLRAGGDTQQLSQELFGWLIAPIADLLDPNRTIAIIPDGALHGLPFAAIQNPRTGKFLIQEFPIIISPSLTYLLASNAATPRRDSIVSFGAQTDDISGARELAALRETYGRVTTFTGQQVNKPMFLQAMQTTPIFHYAGHSAKDAVDPLRSSILLDGNRYGPNSVTAVDIAQQRLKPNALVVLSSCDSSVGNSRDGVGMRGLTSAFLIGGAGSVVGSLWPVEASSTSELMVRFHRSFASSQMPVAHALRKAQLRFIESGSERSHPYYWSGFVVTGNFSALR